MTVQVLVCEDDVPGPVVSEQPAELAPVLRAAADRVLEVLEVVRPGPGHDLLHALRVTLRRCTDRDERKRRARVAGEQREQRVAADAEADEHRALEAEGAQDVQRVEAEADDAELLALVGRAAVTAEIEDDRPVARREPLRDLPPVEGARAGAAVEEDDRDAGATLVHRDPAARNRDAQGVQHLRRTIDCRTTIR